MAADSETTYVKVTKEIHWRHLHNNLRHLQKNYIIHNQYFRHTISSSYLTSHKRQI
jgi:hypothetical protein